jgi:hypothetical protein
MTIHMLYHVIMLVSDTTRDTQQHLLGMHLHDETYNV